MFGWCDNVFRLASPVIRISNPDPDPDPDYRGDSYKSDINYTYRGLVSDIVSIPDLDRFEIIAKRSGYYNQHYSSGLYYKCTIKNLEK